MKLPNLLTGTVISILVLLLTSYVYYDVMNDTPSSGSVWGPRILYSILYALAFSYIYIKSTSISSSKILRGFVVGFVAGVLVISGTMLIYLRSNPAPVFSPGAEGYFIILQNVMMGVVMGITTRQDPCVEDGKTGSGGDD